MSAPDGSFPIAAIVCLCSPSAVASSFAHCHVGLAWLWCCFSMCGIVLGPVCSDGVYCAPFSGVLSGADVCALVYVTGQFVRTVTVSRCETSAFPQSFTSDPGSFAGRSVRVYGRHERLECVSASVIDMQWW